MDGRLQAFLEANYAKDEWADVLKSLAGIGLQQVAGARRRLSPAELRKVGDGEADVASVLAGDARADGGVDAEVRRMQERLKRSVNIYPDWWWQESQSPVVHSGKRRAPPKLAYTMRVVPAGEAAPKPAPAFAPGGGGRKASAPHAVPTATARRKPLAQRFADTRAFGDHLAHVPPPPPPPTATAAPTAPVRAGSTPLEVATALLNNPLVSSLGEGADDEPRASGDLVGGGVESSGGGWARKKGGWVADFSDPAEARPSPAPPAARSARRPAPAFAGAFQPDPRVRWRDDPGAHPAAELWATAPEPSAGAPSVGAALDFDAILASG